MKTGELIFFCGKMGAGKSTKASSIAQERNAVLLCEDEWLESLYPNRITSLSDYIHHAKQIKPQMKKLVQSILETGVDVVMDFPANTVRQRDWFQRIYSEVSAAHTLIYLDVPNSVCLEQIAKRAIEQPERANMDTPEMFMEVTAHFVAPKPAEGFNVMRLTV